LKAFQIILQYNISGYVTKLSNEFFLLFVISDFRSGKSGAPKVSVSKNSNLHHTLSFSFFYFNFYKYKKMSEGREEAGWSVRKLGSLLGVKQEEPGEERERKANQKNILAMGSSI